jgi:hypothetical protein
MKTMPVVALLLLPACASIKPPVTSGAPGGTPAVNIVVTAQSPLRQSDADLFRKITQQYVHRYVRDGRPLTVSITLGEQMEHLLGRDASSNGYWLVDVSYSAQSGHTVPLAGGMSAAQVGFIPTVGGGGAYSSPVYFGGVLTASYSIADSSGKVLESRQLPVVPLAYLTPYLGTRLQDFHDTGMYIAKRVAKVR